MIIFSSFGFKDLIKKIGVERVYTAGKNKSTRPLHGGKPEDIELKNTLEIL